MNFYQISSAKLQNSRTFSTKLQILVNYSKDDDEGFVKARSKKKRIVWARHKVRFSSAQQAEGGSNKKSKSMDRNFAKLNSIVKKSRMCPIGVHNKLSTESTTQVAKLIWPTRAELAKLPRWWILCPICYDFQQNVLPTS